MLQGRRKRSPAFKAKEALKGQEMVAQLAARLRSPSRADSSVEESPCGRRLRRLQQRQGTEGQERRRPDRPPCTKLIAKVKYAYRGRGQSVRALDRLSKYRWKRLQRVTIQANFPRPHKCRFHLGFSLGDRPAEGGAGFLGGEVRSMSPARRRELVDREHPSLSLARQCGLLGVSRSRLYYRPRAASAEGLSLMGEIDRQYLETPFYGSRRMRARLERAWDAGELEAGTVADAGHGAAGHLPAAQHQPPVGHSTRSIPIC